MDQPAAAPPRGGSAPALPTAATRDDLDLAGAIRFAVQVAQLGLLLFVVGRFQVESAAFPRLLLLILAGFVVHHLLPLRLRLPAFALLSLTSIGFIMGPLNAAWLVGLGATLILLAHVPVGFRVRVALILVVGAAFALLRAGTVATPISGAVWPILGSMFMFRMIAYLYDLRHRAAAFGPWHALAYFFMVPNVAFPLFPVVDYKAFVRSHYNDRSLDIYQTGLTWMVRGATQLILYRFVYQNLMLDVASVGDMAQGVRYMLATYLLYLKVSGTFHLVVGILHLFGFNLSETHHKYLLASSFTDFWRRINIYWKNFIEKLFFKPAFFWLGRRGGRNAAMIGATAFAFLATWILHSYQWFWIRGTFPMSWQDAVFWWLLGALVVVNLFTELKSTGGRSLKAVALTPRAAARKALATMSTFTAIVVLWTLWSTGSLTELGHLAAALARVTPAGLALVVGVLLAVGVGAVVSGGTRQAQTDITPAAGRQETGPFWRSTAVNVAILVALVGVSLVPGRVLPGTRVAEVVSHVMVRDFLSAKDRKTLERGYYEDLTNVERFSPELAAIYGKQPEDWAESDAIVTDYTRFPFVFWAPSAHSRFRGAEITTNQWGMRDREYTREKPPGVYRIALLGSSHSAGSGVGDAETYENLVEDRLNRERDPGAPKYEVLNFSMGGYGAISKLATLEQKALGFSPDLVLFEITSEYERIVQNLNTAEEHGVVIPYDFVNRALAEAGVTSGTPRVEVFNRMMPRAPDLLRAAFARADSSCRAAGARMVVVVLPETTDPGEAALRSWRGAGAIAGELGIPFLDLTAAYRDAGPLEDLWVAPWDRHPNPRGHALLADALYPKLVGVLTPSP